MSIGIWAGFAKYRDVKALWLFIILFRWLYTHNESRQRFAAHAADSLQEAEENYEAMLKIADELGYNMPNLKAVGVHLQSALQSGVAQHDR